MDKTAKQRLLRRAAERAALRSSFLAGVLDRYREFHHLSEDELAAHLGCTIEQLPRLGLCGRPHALSPEFRAQVEQITAYTGADSVRLAQVVREVDATVALQRGEAAESAMERGFLLAARDREEAPETEGAEPGETGIEDGEPGHAD